MSEQRQRVVNPDYGYEPALEAARELEEVARIITNPADGLDAEKRRRQAENIRDIVAEFRRLREAVWPGLPAFEPTPEKPQEDFYVLVAEGLRDCFDQHAELLAVCKTLRARLAGFVGALAETTDCTDDAAALLVADEVIARADRA